VIRRVLISGILCVLVVSSFASAETLQEKLDREKAALDSLHSVLEEDREVLNRTERQKVSFGSKLDRLQKDAIQKKRELRELSLREKSLSLRVNKERDALATAERKLKERESGIAERLRTSYKLSRQNPLTVLLSGSSLSEGVRRLKYLGRAAQQDRVDQTALASARESVRRNLKLRQIQRTHQRTLISATRRKERQVVSLVSDYDGKLRHLRRQETLLKSAIQENSERLVESQGRIQEIIQEIERQRLAGRRLAELPDFDFAGKKGSLPWPVRGEILTRFGRVQDPDLGTWTMNRGVTIAASAGSDVLSIAPGEVMLVDWWRGFGQLVLLRHPAGYYTLYGHLESRSVEVGEILAEGALIGTVGSTGRLDGVSQLHFEIMQVEAAGKTSPSSPSTYALDPTLWFKPQP
jgi:septal ring factor EnvC (AmiA/AmiB activator)